MMEKKHLAPQNPPASARREDRLLLGVLVAVLLIAVLGRALSGTLFPLVETIAPIHTRAGEGIVVEGELLRIDINLADEELLITLPGIGPVLAERIIAHRQAHGAFASIDEIKQVKGIGDAVFDGLRERICVE